MLLERRMFTKYFIPKGKIHCSKGFACTCVNLGVQMHLLYISQYDIQWGKFPSSSFKYLYHFHFSSLFLLLLIFLKQSPSYFTTFLSFSLYGSSFTLLSLVLSVSIWLKHFYKLLPSIEAAKWIALLPGGRKLRNDVKCTESIISYCPWFSSDLDYCFNYQKCGDYPWCFFTEERNLGLCNMFSKINYHTLLKMQEIPCLHNISGHSEYIISA